MLHAPSLQEVLRSALDPAPAHAPAPGDRLAAVLAPLVESPEPSLIFTVRADALSRHPGEVSFPGGLVDEGESPADAARREAFEEIGLDPGLPRLVGALPPVHTYVSAILVVPFVGLLTVPPDLFAAEAEIKEIVRVPLAGLAAVEEPMELPREDGSVWQGWAYPVDGHTVWGATGLMVHSFLDVLRAEAPWTLT
ncbi:MAG TPA: CoA pyrophosphatase [Actinomycetota bacterium]|nr:CoA pyrophosphatase [Actinomycetota bacterium]